MLSRIIFAVVAVAVVAIWPRSRMSAAVALGAGLLSVLVAGWGVAADTVRATGPMLVFLTVALTLAALAERAGLARRAVGVSLRRAAAAPDGSTRWSA